MQHKKILSSLKYEGKCLVPTVMLDFPTPDGFTNGILSIRFNCFNSTDFKSSISVSHLEYVDKASKRLSFRAAKLIITTIGIIKEHGGDIKYIPPHLMMKLTKIYGLIFGIPLDGLASYENIKNLIVDKILNDIVKLNLENTKVSICDIKPGTEYSLVRIFSLKTHYRR